MIAVYGLWIKVQIVDSWTDNQINGRNVPPIIGNLQLVFKKVVGFMITVVSKLTKFMFSLRQPTKSTQFSLLIVDPIVINSKS